MIPIVLYNGNVITIINKFEKITRFSNIFIFFSFFCFMSNQENFQPKNILITGGAGFMLTVLFIPYC